MGILIGLNLVGDNELNISIHNDDKETFSGQKTRSLIADFNISFNKSARDKNPPKKSVSANLESENTNTSGRVNVKFEPADENFGSVNTSLEGVTQNDCANVIDLTDEPLDENRTDSFICQNKLEENNEESFQSRATIGYYHVEKILGSRLNPTTKKHEFLLSLQDCISAKNSWNPVVNSEDIDLSDPDYVLYAQKSNDQMNFEEVQRSNSIGKTGNARNETWNLVDMEEPLTKETDNARNKMWNTVDIEESLAKEVDDARNKSWNFADLEELIAKETGNARNGVWSSVKMEESSMMKREIEEDQFAPHAINSPSTYRGIGVMDETLASLHRSMNEDESLAEEHVENCNSRKIWCTRCPRSFKTEFNLRQHFKTHTKNKEYRCTMCGCAYPRSTLLKYHQQKAHRLRYLRNSRLRINHRMRRHNNKENKRNTVIKAEAVDGDAQLPQGSVSQPSPQYNRSFDSNSSPQKHEKNKSSIYVTHCTICNKKMWYSWQREVHAKMHHNAASTVSSTIVESSTSDQSQFNACSECNKRFAFKADALFHEQMAHHDTDKIKCLMCGFIFKESNQSKWSLRRHLFLHTGERPFKCEFCQDDFILKTELRLHLKKRHGVE